MSPEDRSAFLVAPSPRDHVNKFIADGELGDSVTRKFRVTAADGKPYDTTHYALDVAFYVGYRVNSAAGVLFRKWATAILIRFATKGFVVDKERLKEPDEPGLVAQLRDIVDEIRASGANAYRQVKRLCTLCPTIHKSNSAPWPLASSSHILIDWGEGRRVVCILAPFLCL